MRSYSFLQREYLMQVIIFSESSVIQEMGKEFGIRVISKVESIYFLLFILEPIRTGSRCFRAWQEPSKEKRIPPFMPM